MPQSAFKVLYEHIENGKEWFGFVKNLRKDGGYYWVFANISPSYDSNGKMVGYYSVRRKPIDGFKEIIEPLYQSISKIEAEGGMNAGYEEVIKFLNSKKMSFNEFMLAIQKGEINGL